jgi:UTP--glucose-1-phosphate uridylyltransferase
MTASARSDADRGRSIRKAVIPAAGLGTRFLPISKSVPKEMLPIVDRPVIQYVVEEAVAAGCTDILIITSRHKQSIEDHFDSSPELEARLEAMGRTAELDHLRALAESADIHYIRQGEALGLGHAIGMARRHVGDEPFVVLLGDIVMPPDGGVVPAMIATHERHGGSVVGLMEVADPRDMSNYGCASVEARDETDLRVTGLVEKPALGRAPSTLAIIGRYLFTSAIFDEIDRTGPGVGGEIQITDAMRALLAREPIRGVRGARGRYDTGRKDDYLRCVIDMALARDDLGPALRAIIADVVERGELG